MLRSLCALRLRSGWGPALALLVLMTACGSNPTPSPMAHGGDTDIKERSFAQMPEFTFSDLAGNRVSSGRFQGKVLLLDVWATWCQPCKEEMPWFQELHEKYQDRGLAVVGVSIDPSASDAAEFTKKLGVTYLILHHPAIMQEWGLLGLPTTFIVGRDGKIRKKIIGFEYQPTFEKAVREALEN